jgi:hypothetical protein
MRPAIATPDNESRDWFSCDGTSQTTAGTSVPRGLFTLEKSCCDDIRNQARSTMLYALLGPDECALQRAFGGYPPMNFPREAENSDIQYKEQKHCRRRMTAAYGA